MDFSETVGLGAIAGFTIFLGLPMGRVRWVGDRVRVGLAMFSVGILAFIFMDVTKHGEAVLETAVDHLKHDTGSFGHVLALFALLTTGFIVGTAGIAAVERRLRSRQSATPPLAGGEAAAVLLVIAAGVAVRAPLARVPENTMKFAVGVMLSSFGIFWFAEGAGVSWPGGQASLLAIIAVVLGASALSVMLLRAARARRYPPP